jgi:CheY-like chemotaxis protein
VLRQLRHIEKPQTVLERPEPARSSSPRKGRPCTRDSVLIVDDELSVRNLFHNILRRSLPAVGLEMANDGDTALSAFQQNHHAVVLLDLQMPKVCGEAVFVQLEAFCRAEYWQMPTVVVCTAFDGASSVQKILSKDARHTCLYKPVPRDELVSVIRERLELGATLQ